MQVSREFARAGDLPAWLAVWLPNIVYALIAIGLYRTAPK
jgi:lipopolysaccharide export system permease protein